MSPMKMPRDALHEVGGAASKPLPEVRHENRASEVISPDWTLGPARLEIPSSEQEIVDPRVRELRRQILAGAYRTDDKLDVVVERLWAELHDREPRRGESR